MSFVGVSLLIFILAWVLLSTFSWGSLVYTIEFNLMTFMLSDISLGFSLDWVSKLFLLMVLCITGSVFLYCWSYMNSETSAWRFIFLVLVFVLSMMILISASSLSSLILGWDGLGLSSYYLVVYYQNFKSNLSAFITVVSNRIGDVFIILFMILILLNGLAGFWFKEVLDLMFFSSLSIIILMSAITKSALFPYCTWLPEAMAAPTPVSSLVHSSTLVTAGIYILFRYTSALTTQTLLMLSMISAFTLLLSSVGAIFCQDFKKVIALSTLSQLAFMGMVMALGLPVLAFFHLITHAMFKSCLFMGAGSLLHLAQSNQDMRWSTNYKPSWGNSVSVALPIMALTALPFTSGYFSKELILLVSMGGVNSLFMFILLFAGALFTIIYSLRLLNNLSLFSSMAKVVFVFEDYGSLISILLVLTLSIMGGWFMSHYSFDWFAVNSTSLILFLQSCYIGFLILWVSYVFVFRSQNSPLWASFNYLSPFSFSEVGRTISISSIMITTWESGWVEMLGPMHIQKITQNFTHGVYLLSSANYKTLLGLMAVALIMTFIIV